MRGEIAGVILPAVKSCRGRHGEIVGHSEIASDTLADAVGEFGFFGTSVFAATQLRRDRKVPSSD